MIDDDAAFYLPDGDCFVGTEMAQGAWDVNSQTGVAVLALLGHVLEDLPTLTPMGLARITVDLVRPVPIRQRLAVQSKVVREGKKIQVLDLAVTVGDIEHARARVLRLRELDVSHHPDVPASSTTDDPATRLPPPDEVDPLQSDQGPGMIRALDMRPVRSGADAPYFWVRPRVPIVAGEPIRATSRQTIGVDFTNCVGSVIQPGVVTTINPDVSAQFLRAPRGEWIAIVGDTRFEHTLGRGVSAATLSDQDGVFAACTASQLVQPLT